MNQGKKQLYCDLDSTLNNHWVRIAKWTYPKYPNTTILPQAFLRKEVMLDLPLLNAVEGLRLLHTKYDIHILSARSYLDAYEVTRDWLLLYTFPFDSINIVKKAHDKLLFLKNRQCDLLIDDLSAGQEEVGSYVRLYTDIIAKLHNLNIKLLLFKHENYWQDIITMFNLNEI